MPRTTLTFALCALIALGAGAAGSWLTRSKGGVAVVDLDRVAKELGRDVQMANDLRANQSNLAAQLQNVEKSAVEQLTKIKAELGDSPEPDKVKEFAQKAQNAQVNFNSLQKQAIAAIGQRRDLLVASFRQEARPVAEKVAKASGAAAVVTKNDAFLFYADNTIDITDQVIAEMRNAPKAAPTAAAPAESKAAPAEDKKVRQASASTTKPAPKSKAAAAKKDE